MNTIDIEILRDGTLVIKTKNIDAGSHMSADQLVLDIEKLAGGKTTREKNPDAKNHAYMHKHNLAHSH